jgi:hypothetical protein
MPTRTKEQIAMAALRASVHFSGELLSIVESNLPVSTFTHTQIAARLAQDIAAMQAFVDLLRPAQTPSPQNPASPRNDS